MATQIEISFQNLPSDYCFTTPQQLGNDIASRLTGSIAGLASLYVISKSTPAVAYQTKLWQKLNSDGSPERIYRHWDGLWVSQHQTPVSSAERRIWTGSTAELVTYDGGAAGAVTAVSGPMWEVDSDYAARFPFGVGTTANGTIIAVGDTGGVDEVTLTLAQIPAHVHGNAGRNGVAAASDGEDIAVEGDTDSAGGGEAHTNLPPWIGAYFIKRTARKFYVSS